MLLRKNEIIGKEVNKTLFSVDNLVMPLFVTEGINIKKPIKNFPGIFHLSINNILKEIDEIGKFGVSAILVFGVTCKKWER